MAQYQTNYSTLVATLTDFVEDDSSEYAAQVNNMINRAEERILRDVDLSLFNETASGTTAASTSSFTKSFSDTHVHTIFFTAAKEHANRRTRDFVVNYGGSGRPLYFYEDKTTVLWAPVPDAVYAYDITYVVRPTKLSVSNTTNWITTNASDLLLWASLVESEAFLLAPERVAEFEGKYQQMLGPVRGLWRPVMQTQYEPINPTPTPQQTR